MKYAITITTQNSCVESDSMSTLCDLGSKSETIKIEARDGGEAQQKADQFVDGLNAKARKENSRNFIMKSYELLSIEPVF